MEDQRQYVGTREPTSINGCGIDGTSAIFDEAGESKKQIYKAFKKAGLERQASLCSDSGIDGQIVPKLGFYINALDEIIDSQISLSQKKGNLRTALYQESFSKIIGFIDNLEYSEEKTRLRDKFIEVAIIS